MRGVVGAGGDVGNDRERPRGDAGLLVKGDGGGEIRGSKGRPVAVVVLGRDHGIRQDLLGAPKVTKGGRALDGDRSGNVGKPGAGVVGKPIDNLLVAVPQQRVRHAGGDLQSSCDGQKMVLAFAPGNVDEIAVGQPARLRQDRRGYPDIVIPCKLTNGLLRVVRYQ